MFLYFQPLPELGEHLSGASQFAEGGDTEIATGGDGGPIICKMEPFNICYKVDTAGNMHPVGDRRPVRLLRVY
jgi:hypothetical protein